MQYARDEANVGARENYGTDTIASSGPHDSLTPTPPGEIQQIIEELAREVHFLNELLPQLMSKLDPIVPIKSLSEQKGELANEETGVPASTRIGKQLSAISTTIRRNRRALKELIKVVQV